MNSFRRSRGNNRKGITDKSAVVRDTEADGITNKMITNHEGNDNHYMQMKKKRSIGQPTTTATE